MSVSKNFNSFAGNLHHASSHDGNWSGCARLLGFAFVVLFSFQRIWAADFAVAYTGSSAYSFNGAGSNPTLTLIRGQTYTFAVSSPGSHPFRIVNPPAGTTTGNNTSSGTITF